MAGSVTRGGDWAMKKVLTVIVALSLAVLLAPGVMASPALVELDRANLSNADLTAGGKASSFNAEAPGWWGGAYGDGAVTAFPGDPGDPGDPDDAGYVTLETLKGAAKVIEIRHLDGLTDDSFDVLVKDNHGNWVLIGSYADAGTAETWVTSRFVLPNGSGLQLARGGTIEIKILPTNVGWWGIDTWGQLAIDYVALLGRGSRR